MISDELPEEGSNLFGSRQRYWRTGQRRHIDHRLSGGYFFVLNLRGVGGWRRANRAENGNRQRGAIGILGSGRGGIGILSPSFNFITRISSPNLSFTGGGVQELSRCAPMTFLQDFAISVSAL